MDKKRDWVAEASQIRGMPLGIGKMQRKKLEQLCRSIVEAMEDARCHAEETIFKGKEVRWHNETEEKARARRDSVRARRQAKDAQKSLEVMEKLVT